MLEKDIILLTPVKKTNLADLAVDEIRHVIIGRNLLPGSCIGTERQMCRQLNVSRPILREALSTLKAQGFIRVTSNGVVVNSMTPTTMIEPIEQVLDEDKEKIFELNEVRKILESGMGALAIGRATAEDIDSVQEALKNLERSYLNGELGHKEDVQFHLRLAESSHNSIFIHVLHTVLDLFEKGTYLYRSGLISKPGNADIMMEQHRGICDAFLARNPERLSKAIVDHLTWSGNQLRDLSKQTA